MNIVCLDTRLSGYPYEVHGSNWFFHHSIHGSGSSISYGVLMNEFEIQFGWPRQYYLQQVQEPLY